MSLWGHVMTCGTLVDLWWLGMSGDPRGLLWHVMCGGTALTLWVTVVACVTCMDRCCAVMSVVVACGSSKSNLGMWLGGLLTCGAL